MSSLEDTNRRQQFEVHLENFDGPFDLLLGLIAKREMDVTDVALGIVTDEFLAYLNAAKEADRLAIERGDDYTPWDLGVASEFVLVAATLLDLKVARLVTGDSTDEFDPELLEARDLLFARLLQYRAFKQVASLFARRLSSEGQRIPRQVLLDPEWVSLLPELIWEVDSDGLADLASLALGRPILPKEVDTSHVHTPKVSVTDRIRDIGGCLRERGAVTFHDLVGDGEPIMVAATFLAVLEMFRAKQVELDQPEPLGELLVSMAEGADGGSDAVASAYTGV